MPLFGAKWIITSDSESAMPQHLVGRIALGLDLARLRAETESLLGQHPLIFETTRQLALQTRPGSTDPWYECCYSETNIAPEEEYHELNPELRGTYFEEVLATFPFPVFRMRLLALTGRSCYSVHRDKTARIHVAIETSEHAPFVFVERNEVFRVPADGDGYWLDTREVHTALNGGRLERLHLVAGVDV